jgi:hypothetical protein
MYSSFVIREVKSYNWEMKIFVFRVWVVTKHEVKDMQYPLAIMIRLIWY